MKLTKPQRQALLAVEQNERPYGVRKSTLEALRRRGLVECHSLWVTKGYYRDDAGEHRQRWNGWWHFWYLRPAGRALLSADSQDDAGSAA